MFFSIFVILVIFLFLCFFHFIFDLGFDLFFPCFFGFSDHIWPAPLLAHTTIETVLCPNLCVENFGQWGTICFSCLVFLGHGPPCCGCVVVVSCCVFGKLWARPSLRATLGDPPWDPPPPSPSCCCGPPLPPPLQCESKTESGQSWPGRGQTRSWPN